MENPSPLHTCHVDKSSLIINRIHTLIHASALLALFYYRATYAIILTTTNELQIPLFPYLLVFTSELLLFFIWLLSRAYRWRPVTREAFPERLPGDDKLPPIDVFVCTADPEKEPTEEVMNTVLSCMALDYPPEKLHVYLSDDGGSGLTLDATREAWVFATWWIPFCRRYGVRIRCPEAYFSGGEDEDCHSHTKEFRDDCSDIKQKYEDFKMKIEEIRENAKTVSSKDHPAYIEVISDEYQERMPQLIYVSREKRPSHHHNFKAGALNVLLRVSGMISNSPYILTVDCDMQSNDPASARRAMCFYLDHNISQKLAFVQYPQKFHNISENDIYDSQLRVSMKMLWKGMDGHRGPCLIGSGFYLRREALYGTSNISEDVDIVELQKSFGPSNEFMKSLLKKKSQTISTGKELSSDLLQEILMFLASCTYENHSKWGKEVGFLYFSVVEDCFTSITIHCKGWISVFLDPPRPQFLGAGTTNLSESLIQRTRWSVGLLQIGLSKFSPILYGPMRMSLLQSMSYASLALDPLHCFPVWCLATIPQLCLVHGIPLYAQVSHPSFILFPFILLSHSLKETQEIISTGDPIRLLINEHRIWIMRSLSSYMYATFNCIMDKIGMKKASFMPTNKVVDDEKVRLYQMGVFDFRVSTMLLAPICTAVILNLVCLIIGLLRVLLLGSFDRMFVQIFIALLVVVLNYPVVEGMFLRRDEARVQPSVTLLSLGFAMIFLILGSVVLAY